MPLETLPANPSPDVNIKRTQKPNLKIAQFGDGYSQRTSFGLNQVVVSILLSYTNITQAQKETIEDFINDHNRGQAFLWQMPDEDEPRQWYFVSWDITYVKHGIYTVACNLAENFDIA